MRVFIFSFLLLVMMAATAQAQVRECGIPVKSDLNADPGFQYCDIHQRRLAYKESRDEFHGQLEERRRNYLAPGLEARQAYEKNLENLYNGNSGYNQ